MTEPLNDTQVQKDKITQIENLSFIKGMKAGVRRFAWWKNGTQWVGTCGKTLKEALEEIDRDTQCDSM